MTLAAGTKLGPYEIVSQVGAGGMGEVYRARDTRLGRMVAVKVLPHEVSLDTERRKRFEYEARTISTLNHPHICALYDIGHENQTDYLVLEYLEGETLDQRLDKGAMPLGQALRYGVEIADALDKAHRQGVIHRDLKPANIMLTKSGAKLLDFGLAKLEKGALLTSGTLAAIPTEDLKLTAEGALVGTLQYMPPEQLEGKQADARTDIFALGCVLYEMVGGRPAFTAKTKASLVAAILTSEPPHMSSLQPLSPPGLNRVITACLAKDPEARWQNTADLARELTWLAEAESTPVRENAGAAHRYWLAVLLAAILGAAIGAIAVHQFAVSQAPLAQSVRFAITLPVGEALHEYANSPVALSMDGKLIAYTVNRGDERGIYVRTLDSLDGKWLPGTEQGSNPFFSPDNRWLGFEAGGALKKISLEGGAPQTLCDTPFFTGAAWGPNDEIIFTPVFSAGLWGIAASGGRPRRLAAPDAKQGEHAYLWPEMLPGGETVLFTVWKNGTFDQSQIAIMSLKTGNKSVLVDGGFYARYASSGHIIYERAGNLLAVPFDLEKLRVTGPPVTVLQGVLADVSEGAADFSMSQNGVLAYVPGTEKVISRSLLWADRSGRAKLVTEAARPYGSPRISPDGRRVALWTEDAMANIWVYELSRGTMTKVSYGADDHSEAWSPDGRQLAFESSRSGVHQLYVRAADGTGDEEQVTKGEYEHYLADWSPDGRYLMYTEFHPETGADLWVLDLRNHSPRPFLTTPFAEKAAVFSPDGAWVAYVSNVSGQNEVYVQPFEGSGRKWQISNEGGEEPVWARSGHELFYRRGGKVMSVPVTTSPTFTAGNPTPVFSGAYHYNIVPSRAYDVAPDGRFLIKADSEAASHQINIVLGWGEELRRKIPVH
jgi:eukaryotic-like serine/threonine-protein kinase